MDKLFEDINNLNSIIDQTQRTAIELYVGATTRKVAHTKLPSLDLDKLSESGLGTNHTLDIFKQSILPMLSASAGSRFLGFITGGTTPAALIADWLVSVLDQNVMIGGDSIAVDLERQTIEMLKQLFNLPQNNFHGILTTGATASNILAMAIAREWAGDKLGINFSEQGVTSGKIRIYSASSHASINKALSLVGLGRNNLIRIPTLPNREAINTKVLEEQLASNSEMVNIVVANAGTVNTGDFDSINEMADLCKKYNAWLHVDAAFGIFTRLSPNLESLTKGMEKADSITADVHKWLNVPYDCGLFFTRHFDLQHRVFRNNAVYLETSTDQLEPMDVGIENSRRFRTLPVWFSLVAYGADTFRQIVEQHCHLAKQMASRLESSNMFTVLEKPRLNITCFAPLLPNKSVNDTEFTNQFLTEVNLGGEVFFTPTVINEQRFIRAAFSNWRTQQNDVDRIVETLIDIYKALSQKKNEPVSSTQ